MTSSASTPRIRLLQLSYGLLLVATALIEPRAPWGWLLECFAFALIVLAVLGRLWTTLFIAGQKDARLVDSGPYARCRHPLYAWSIVTSVGLGLATRSFILAAAIVHLSTVIHGIAARREEKWLIERWGEAYRAYAARVPRFWPSGRGTAPNTVGPVDVTIYRKAFVDAASIFGLYLAMLVIALGRDAGLWPAVGSLY